MQLPIEMLIKHKQLGGIISAISPATKIKEDARAAVEAKAIAQNQQINSNNMATTEEKEDALNQVEAHKAAIATINQAQSTQQVSEAKNNGINTINQDQPNAVKKNNTKTILEQKETRKKSAIAQTPDATEEKQEAVSAVSQAVTNGIPISTKQILMMMLIKNLVMQNKLLLILMSMFKNLKPDKH